MERAKQTRSGLHEPVFRSLSCLYASFFALRVYEAACYESHSCKKAEHLLEDEMPGKRNREDGRVRGRPSHTPCFCRFWARLLVF